ITIVNSTVSASPFSGIALFRANGDLRNVTAGRLNVVEAQLSISNSVLESLSCLGSVHSNGYNLIKDVYEGCLVLGQYIPADALLGPIQDNGGPLFGLTRLPTATSPAIDAGDPAGCLDALGNPLTTDQRGVSRPIGTRCDLGSVEAGSPVDGIPSLS